MPSKQMVSKVAKELRELAADAGQRSAETVQRILTNIRTVEAYVAQHPRSKHLDGVREAFAAELEQDAKDRAAEEDQANWDEFLAELAEAAEPPPPVHDPWFENLLAFGVLHDPEQLPEKVVVDAEAEGFEQPVSEYSWPPSPAMFEDLMVPEVDPEATDVGMLNGVPTAGAEGVEADAEGLEDSKTVPVPKRLRTV